MNKSYSIWDGEASLYDQTRPAPPSVLLDILTQLIHSPRPSLVVDMGCGTGLSTMIWGERAEQVIGIEPSEDMRNTAMKKLASHPYAEHIKFQEGFAHQTGLPDNSVDIVTCSQSFHWMEPTITLVEIARILRPGGVFAVYDYHWPPLVSWEFEQIYQEVDEIFERLVRERREENPPRWSKEKHLERMHDSGHFRLTREFFLHHTEQGDGNRLIGMLLSGAYGHLVKRGMITLEEIGFDQLKQAALQYVGTDPIPWHFSYQVRIGVK